MCIPVYMCKFTYTLSSSTQLVAGSVTSTIDFGNGPLNIYMFKCMCPMYIFPKATGKCHHIAASSDDGLLHLFTHY